jgi:hypothetical protein
MDLTQLLSVYIYTHTPTQLGLGFHSPTWNHSLVSLTSLPPPTATAPALSPPQPGEMSTPPVPSTWRRARFAGPRASLAVVRSPVSSAPRLIASHAASVPHPRTRALGSTSMVVPPLPPQVALAAPDLLTPFPLSCYSSTIRRRSRQFLRYPTTLGASGSAQFRCCRCACPSRRPPCLRYFPVL